VITALLGIVVGAVLIWGSGRELFDYLRARRRLRRVSAVVVGRAEVSRGPNTHSRSAVFRFTTEEGRPVETTSDLSTFPGKKVGTRLTVLYDPRDPEEAEIAWVRLFKAVLSPLLMVGGVALIVLGVRQL